MAPSTLRLRISPGLGILLDDRTPQSQAELASQAQQRMARSPAWLYEQRERSYIVYILSNEELTFLMQKPGPLGGSEVDWDFEIINLRQTTADDRYAMLGGSQIADVTVLPASHEAAKGTVVDRVFAIILNYDRYEHMTQHDRFLVSAAWKRAHRGRQYEGVKLGAYTVYQMTAITADASTSSDTAELDTILRDYEIGRVSTDPFELRLLGAMLAEKRRTP